MEKLYVDIDEKKRILESHGLIGEQNNKEELKSLEGQKNYFLNAIKKGCLTGTEANIKMNPERTSYVFEKTTKSGKKVTYFIDELKGNNTAKVDGVEGLIVWKCPEIVKGLETFSPKQLINQAEKAQTEVDENFTLESCTKFIDSYFLLAKDALYTDDLVNMKKSINACFNKHQAKLSKETRDQLRWLSGGQPKILGFLEKYPRMGTINDSDRKIFRLDRNFD